MKEASSLVILKEVGSQILTLLVFFSYAVVMIVHFVTT